MTLKMSLKADIPLLISEWSIPSNLATTSNKCPSLPSPPPLQTCKTPLHTSQLSKSKRIRKTKKLSSNQPNRPNSQKKPKISTRLKRKRTWNWREESRNSNLSTDLTWTEKLRPQPMPNRILGEAHNHFRGMSPIWKQSFPFRAGSQIWSPGKESKTKC